MSSSIKNTNFGFIFSFLIITLVKRIDIAAHESETNDSIPQIMSTQSRRTVKYCSTETDTCISGITMKYTFLNQTNITQPIKDCRLFKEDMGYLLLEIYPHTVNELIITFAKGISIVKEKNLMELDYEISKNSTNTNLTVINSTLAEPIKLCVKFYSMLLINDPVGESRIIVNEIHLSTAKAKTEANCSIPFFKKETRRESIIFSVSSPASTTLTFTFEFKDLGSPTTNYYLRIVKNRDINNKAETWSQTDCITLQDQYSTPVFDGLKVCNSVENCPFYYQVELYNASETETKDCTQVYYSSSDVIYFPPNKSLELPEKPRPEEPEPDPDPLEPLTNTTSLSLNTEKIVIICIGSLLGGGVIGFLIFCTIKIYSRAKAKSDEFFRRKEEQTRIENKDRTGSIEKKSSFGGEECAVEINSRRSLGLTT